MKFKRRTMLGTLAAGLAALPASARAQMQPASRNATDLDVIADIGIDQSAELQAAIRIAELAGTRLFMPAGHYVVSNIELPSNCTIFGVRGATILQSPDGRPIVGARDKSSITLVGLTLDGQGAGRDDGGGLAEFSNCSGLNVRDCTFANAQNNGAYISKCSGRVRSNEFRACGQSAIHLQNSTGMLVSDNGISDCGNGGIRVWRSESGADGTIVTNNQIQNIGSDAGDGQNGNGINIFRADQVLVANNVIRDCAFSAVRANATNDTIISNNQCINSSEVAIFSEFAFSGSIISNNIVDGAARGISITNFNDGGRLAVCSDNIVRNILPFSPTNPNTRPVGIFVEADSAVSGNVIENVPGIGILAGWGPYLRNVLVANNIVRQTEIGIGVSVAEGAGFAKITGNLIAGAERAVLAGLAWREMVSDDLLRDQDRFAHISLSGNSLV
jgi:uncharacterized secreted repeat protein (TIGR03808 family)